MNLFSKSLAVLGLASASVFAGISYSPVTEGATESAQKLYNFLAVNYGVKTIAGIQTGELETATFKALPDVDSFYVRTGKYPAIVGLDFLFATGVKASDSWYQSYTKNIIDAAKDLWAQGGIPAFTWHWKDPSDQVDEFYATQKAAGEGKQYTTYDFTQGFNDPSCTTNCTWNENSTTYSQLKSDIDEIAAYFLELQQAGAAAIFRPVHEASGGWFWWGTRGGAAFQALYKLIYDEMNSLGVKNLVWVWNPEYATDTGWNPGESYYDIISLDIYEAYDYSSKFLSARKDLEKNFGSDKIFAISENGPIPDLSVMAENNSRWSWWMPWYQTWDRNFLNQTVNAVWKANVESPCAITLSEMPGWDNYTISDTPVASCEVGYELKDLDTARIIEEFYPGDTANNGWLRVRFNTPTGDTARGNVIIGDGSYDLSTESKVTLNVFNGNKLSGIWFTIAFLGNESTGWAWAQPDGCWINASDSTACEINLATTTMDGTVLTGSDYTNFMSNISKIYIEISSPNYAGSIFFDNVRFGNNVFESFDDSKKSFKVDQPKNLFVAEIVGMGKAPTAIAAKASVSKLDLSLQNGTLSITIPKSGKTSIALFDATGHLVRNLSQGSLFAGIQNFSLENLPRGNYMVRVKGNGFATAKAIRLR